MSGSLRDRSPRRVRTQIWLLNAALATGAVGLGVVVSRLGQPGDLDHHVPLWLLALLFAALEVLVVHVRFRDDSHTFSMVEAAIALGLLTASPLGLLAAQAVGAGIVFAVHRRLPLIKWVFNVAQQWMGTAAAIGVVHLVLGSGDALGPRAWLAVAAGVVASSIVGTLSIVVVLRLSTGALSIRSHVGAAWFAIANSLLSASLGLVAVVMLAARPSAAILLVVPAASVFATNLAYVSQRDKHQRLEFLYGTTRVLAASHTVEEGIDRLLEEMRDALRCDLVSLVYRPVDATDHVLVSVSAGDLPRRSMERVGPEGLETGWWNLLDEERRGSVPGTFLSTLLSERIVVPLVGETRRVGLLIAARTDRSVNALTANDHRMVEALASQLTVTLENGRLEQSNAQLRELQQALTYRASHDSLTDLANRSLFTELVTTSFRTDPKGVGVMFIDLDDFKSVNDTLGHAAGDALLVETACRLRSVVGERGVPARLGGDEFAVLLANGATASGARGLADDLLDAFGPLVTIDGRDVRIKATIGIALGHTALDPDGLLRNADIAMYAAKSAGKGCHRLFHAQMHDVVLHRQDLVERLDGAHDRGEIVTFFQPIVDLATGNPKGAEALVRWVHPVHGVLAPDTFIALAEETGRIGDITRFVLEQACVEALSWDARLDAPSGAYVSVNLSPRDFADPSLADAIERTLIQTGLPAERLLIELTETALHDDTHIVRTLNRIRSTGVKVAIDDFGTGFSSLARLRTLPFDVLKVAEPLVASADRGGRDRDLARLMVDLSRVMGVEAIAEGIETAGQAAALRELGFGTGQGHYYCPALPSNEVWRTWRTSSGARRATGRDRRAPGGRRAADISLVTPSDPPQDAAEG